MKILTTYYADLKNLSPDVVPISIAGKKPEGVGILEYKRLAPSWSIFSEYKYNGGTQDVATITQSPSGIYPESKIKKEYSGDGLENGLPKNAGSYTASMSIEEGGVTYTATARFEIKKAGP